MFFRHDVPGARIAVLKRKIFRVGPISKNDRIAAVLYGAENIGAQDEAVVHPDRHVPIDPHAVADFRALLQRGHACPPRSK